MARVRGALFAVPVALLVLGLAAPVAAGSTQAPPGLSANPLYADGHDGRLRLAGAWEFSRNRGRSWASVHVPHAWNRDPTRPSLPGGVAYYRKTFLAPADGTRGWVLRFESVNQRATVYLNDILIGSHQGGYLPFELKAESLRPGRLNELLVMVDNRSLARNVRTGGRGWWNWGGILREVYLRPQGAVDISGLRTRQDLSRDVAVVDVIAQVRNTTARRQSGELDCAIGEQRVTTPFAVAAGKPARVRAGFELERPRLWSPRRPFLYPLACRATVGGREESGMTQHLGLRTIAVREGRLLLNGRPLRLRGVSLHEDHPGPGGAPGPRERELDLRLIRALNANAIRAQYPLHPATVEAADSAGLLVWAQVPAHALSSRQLARRATLRQVLRLLRGLIMRDREHPSVLVWSLGNELELRQAPDEHLDRYVRSAYALAKRLDPSRPRALDVEAAKVASSPAEAYLAPEVLGLNEYIGWYSGPPPGREQRKMLRQELADARARHPDQALVISEFGAEANRRGPAAERGSYAYQERLLASDLEVFESTPWLGGALVWLLRDFTLRTDWRGGNPKPTPPFNSKGLVGYDGRRKPAFRLVAGEFARW